MSFDDFLEGDTTVRQLLDDCEGVADIPAHNGGPDPAFNDWERGFLESIRNQLNAGKQLTDRQVEILQGLWERI